MTPPSSASRLRAEICNNPRLRLGLLAVAGIAWLYGALLLRDAAQAARDDYRALERKVARVTALARQTEWPARAETARNLQVALEGRLWREGTVGLAQANFQDWLNQTARQSGVLRPQVTVSGQDDASARKSEASDDFWKVSARLSFDFTPKALHDLLGRLARHERQIVVETLLIRSLPAPRAELLLVAYFQKPASPAPLPDAPRGTP